MKFAGGMWRFVELSFVQKVQLQRVAVVAEVAGSTGMTAVYFMLLDAGQSMHWRAKGGIGMAHPQWQPPVTFFSTVFSDAMV